MTTNDEILSSLAQVVAAKRLNIDTQLNELVASEIVLEPPCGKGLYLVLMWRHWLFNYLDPNEMYEIGKDQIFLGSVKKETDRYADNPEAVSSPAACKSGLFKRVTAFEPVTITARNLKRLQKG